MATGYTSDIAEGKAVSFREFAMQCARAIGYMSFMRDEPASAPIPDEYPASTYYRGRMNEVIDEITKITAMSDTEIAAVIEEEYQGFIKSRDENIARAMELRKKYMAMRDEVNKWVPPTKDHQGLKDFMIDQLDDSISHDCNEEYYLKQEAPKKKTVAEWRSSTLRYLAKDLERYSKEQSDDDAFAAEATRWIQDFKKSLPEG